MSERFIHDHARSHHIAELRADDVGATVVAQQRGVSGPRTSGAAAP